MRLLKLDNKGMIFITVLAIVFLLMSIGMTYFLTLKDQIKMNEKHIDSIRAFYYAQAGIEHAMAELISGTDVDSDGLGSIRQPDAADLDGDSVGDYDAVYTPGITLIGTLTSTGTVNFAERTIVASVTNSPWRGALQSDGFIDASNNVFGVLRGDVVSKSTVDLGAPPAINTGGHKAHANFGGSGVPVPDFTSTGYTDLSLTGTVHSDCSSLTPMAFHSGVYHIDGDCDIDGSGGFFHLDGSIIVTGSMSSLTLRNMSSLNITGTFYGGEFIPPIVAGFDVNITGVENATIGGLVYAVSDIWIKRGIAIVPPTITLNDGALVTQGNIIIENINDLDITFDPEMNPPYFSPATLPHRIYRWKGHKF